MVCTSDVNEQSYCWQHWSIICYQKFHLLMLCYWWGFTQNIAFWKRLFIRFRVVGWTDGRYHQSGKFESQKTFCKESAPLFNANTWLRLSKQGGDCSPILTWPPPLFSLNKATQISPDLAPPELLIFCIILCMFEYCWGSL